MSSKKSLPDYSEYLNSPGMLDYIEKEWLKNPKLHDRQANVVNAVMKEQGLSSVLEVGCSTGNCAKRIVADDYTGLDASLQSLFLAMMKNPGVRFIHADIREFRPPVPYNLIFSFAVLKHFSAEEWSKIFCWIVSYGEYAVFDMPVRKEKTDDGIHYHHLWMPVDEIKDQIKIAGHELVSIFYPQEVEPIFVTKKKNRK